MTYWFTADTHIGHQNIIKYSDRPFASIRVMDSTLLGYWKKLMKKGDVFYILGDISVSKRHAMRALNAVPKGVQIHVVLGNHERKHKKHVVNHHRVLTAELMKWVKIKEQPVVLSHYAMRVWGDRKAWQLFGHSHDNLEPWEKQLDVGVDSAVKLLGEYRPFSFEEISKIISDRMDSRILAKEYGKVPSWVGF
jgi:calcineurin-like phosphoesterase family protein